MHLFHFSFNISDIHHDKLCISVVFSVPFREMPTFSSRRPRLSMYGSTLSLMSRSRSDPKLNITSTIDDSNITSPPSSMRSLPQHYQMYSDSGSYSRGSDSPRSMSISSNSSGPGKYMIMLL